MTQLTIRQSGGANIVSIPKVILKSLNLHVGSSLNMSIEDHKIVLTPIEHTYTLEDLLAGSTKESFTPTNEDRKWLDAKPTGKETW